MKLGTQTASVINHLQSRGVIGEPKPVVGMGCTFLAWTDRYAGTIHKVEETNSKVAQYIIEVSKDKTRVIAGSTQDGSADYEYTPRPDADRDTYRKNRMTGFWEHIRKNPETGKWCKTGGNGLRIGERDEYRDPSF